MAVPVAPQEFLLGYDYLDWRDQQTQFAGWRCNGAVARRTYSTAEGNRRIAQTSKGGASVEACSGRARLSPFWYHRAMADAVLARSFASEKSPRHHAVVRVTHWMSALCILALAITGANIVISHPRFYWGETGNVLTPALFELPIPASRSYVKTGYDYVLPDQNGWSRSLHFQAAWLIVFTGVLYGVFGLWSRHFRRNLLPSRRQIPEQASYASYNGLQRIAYASVVFVMAPLMIWTGLAMSPAVASVFPGIVTVFGGHQSARTIHFAVSALLVAFVVVHIVMVFRAGFRKHMAAMIFGRGAV